MKFKALFLSLFLSISLQSEAQRCESLFSTENFSRLSVTENKLYTELSQRIDVELKKISDQIKSKLKSEKNLTVDMLCVGAGPQCASASQIAGISKKSGLVVESTGTIASTFFNKHFFINTVERENLSQHPFPGTRLRMDHLTDRLYVSSQQLGSYIQAVQYSSGIPVLFNTRVVKIEPQTDGSSRVYMNDGSVVHAKKVLLGTGLGEQSTKVKNEAFNNRLKTDLSNTASGQLQKQGSFSSESFLEQIKMHDLRGQNMPLSKNLVLIGNGDGARIALEGLLALNVKLPAGFKVIWVGNGAKTAEEYVAGLGNQERYAPMVKKLFEQGLIEGIDGRCQDVIVKADGQFIVKSAKISEAGETISESSFETATVIDSTGYTNMAVNLVEGYGQKKELADVRGSMNDFGLTDTVLGRQLMIGEKPADIFLIGPSAGNLVTPEELKSLPARNPVAMYNNVPRTAYLVAQMFKAKVSFSVGVRERIKTSTLSLDEIWLMLKNERSAKLQ